MPSQLTDDVGLARVKTRIGQPQTVPFEKAVPQLIAIARPAALTAGESDPAHAPDNIAKRGSTCGIVEVFEAPRTFCQRELLDVRIAMEAHDRRAGHACERLADALG